jgi:hypothetical protein
MGNPPEKGKKKKNKKNKTKQNQRHFRHRKSLWPVPPQKTLRGTSTHGWTH